MRWLRYILSLGRLGGRSPSIPTPHFTWILGSKDRRWEFSNIERSWTLESKDRIWNLPSRK